VRLDYIITGTSRCRTLFAANFLTSAGVPCSHEAVFTPRGIDYALEVINGEEIPASSKISKGDNLSDHEMDIVADSSYMSAPFLNDFLDPSIIHMVRSPFRVISSFIGLGFFSRPFPMSYEYNPDHFEYENFVYSWLPELTEEMSYLDRVCLYWTAWNEMIEASRRVAIRQRIEDPKDALSEFIGNDGTYSNEKCNVLKKSDFNWSLNQIDNPSIRRRLKDLAKKYGYIKI
jgi:hypothetical protein